MGPCISLLALGLGVYLAIAIASFPAAVAYRWFAPPELSLALVEGTLWNGSAAYGGVAGLGFSNLRWQLRPAALLTGRVSLSAETSLATGFARTDLTASGDRLSLKNLSASTDLRTFRDLLPLGDIRGQVSVTLDTLEFVDGWPIDASGEARVGELAMPPLVPIQGVTLVQLGNYRAQFASTDGTGIDAALNDQGGPIELTGRLNLTTDRNYLIDTLLKPRADASQELVQGIEMLAEPPNASGQRRFRLAGAL